MSPFSSPEEVSRLSEPDPEFLEVLKTIPHPNVDLSDTNAFITHVSNLQAEARSCHPPPSPSIQETDVTYPNRSGQRLRARVYRRPSPTPLGPLVLLFHGGGGCVGTPEDEAPGARLLVTAFNAVCITPSYRLAPSDPYPSGLNDAWDSLVHFSQYAPLHLNADPTLGFLITGTSAGACFCVTLSHLARDNDLTPPLTGVHLSCGVMLPPTHCPPEYLPYHQSHSRDSDPVLTSAVHSTFQRIYGADLSSPIELSALHPLPTSPSSPPTPSLPPHFIQAAGLDLARDDSIVYEMILRDKWGVKTRLEVTAGVPHAWFAFFDGLEKSKDYWRGYLRGFGWLLGEENGDEEDKQSV
ncbi:putative lipase 2 [Phaeomoniella chlamydospora]|uniref:Putative lipase 2 n=1 Tax=Phaeomoniella chlamydospora TaxID=158046 RepID=A0A0G2H6V6_PHACM|nr:putative lipase 2 [Phaeomoniella chlamydospora]